MIQKITIATLCFLSLTGHVYAAPAIPSNTLISSFPLNKTDGVAFVRAAGDLNGDGKEDFIGAGYSTVLTLNKLYGISTSTGAQLWNSIVGKPITSIDVADIDGDGIKDVAVSTDSLPSQGSYPNPQDDGFVRLVNGAHGQLICEYSEPPLPPQTQNIKIKNAVIIGDINGNGTQDVIINISANLSPAYYHKIRILDGGNCQPLVTVNLQALGYGPPKDIKAFYDIDGDQVVDFVAVIDNPNSYVLALSGKTGNVIWTKLLQGNNTLSVSAIRIASAPGHFSRKSNLIINAIGSNPQILSADGRTGATVWSKPYFSLDGVATVRDANNDANDDILIYDGKLLSGSNGSIIWQYSGPHPFENGTSVDMVSAKRDLNGDGITDIIKSTRDSGSVSGQPGQPAILVINGKNGQELSFIFTGTGWSNGIMGLDTITDVNGNGSPDIVFGGWHFTGGGTEWSRLGTFDGKY